MDISPQSNPGAGRDDGRQKINSQKGFSLKAKKRKKTDVTGAHGTRIIRSAGRKDRHSKVCTARGTRDRRVRLAPKTAIQFYDVQDRLGYDRPSKAIDWLMSEAKSAIDALELPPPPPAAASLNCTDDFENFGFFTNNSELQVYSEFPDCFEWNYGNSPPPQVFGHNEIQSSPREPLQSSFSRFSNCSPTGIEYGSEDFTAGENQLEIDHKTQFSSASFLHYEE